MLKDNGFRKKNGEKIQRNDNKQAGCTTEANSSEKYQYCLLAQLFPETESGSARSYLSGNNTPEIVHLTKRNNITQSKVVIKTCFTTSEKKY